MRRLTLLCLPLTLLATTCSSTPPSGGRPVVEEIRCTPRSIPCNDNKETVVSCRGVGGGFTGGARFIWQCIPPACELVGKEGAAPCEKSDVYLQCDSTTNVSEVEIRCPGRVAEQCTMRILKDGVLTDTQDPSTRFGITLDPACPPPDMGMPDMPDDMGDGGPGDAGPDADVAPDAAPDAKRDAEPDAAPDAAPDAQADAAADAKGDAATDAAPDAEGDATGDAAADAAADAAPDAAGDGGTKG